jgi:hypothetical protein
MKSRFLVPYEKKFMNNGQEFHQYQQSEQPHVSFLKLLEKNPQKTPKNPKKPTPLQLQVLPWYRHRNVEMVSLCNLNIKEQKKKKNCILILVLIPRH